MGIYWTKHIHCVNIIQNSQLHVIFVNWTCIGDCKRPTICSSFRMCWCDAIEYQATLSTVRRIFFAIIFGCHERGKQRSNVVSLCRFKHQCLVKCSLEWRIKRNGSQEKQPTKKKISCIEIMLNRTERKKNNALETSPVDECSGKKWLNAKFNDFDFLLGFVHYAFSNMHIHTIVEER